MRSCSRSRRRRLGLGYGAARLCAGYGSYAQPAGPLGPPGLGSHVDAAPLGQLLAGEAQGLEATEDGYTACWRKGGFAFDDCCSTGPLGATRAALNQCFDSIFTRRECCAARGRARISPASEAEATDWEEVARWAAAASASGGRRGSSVPPELRHPGFSRAQYLWEVEMTNSSRFLEEDILGHRVRLHVFKRSGPAISVVMRELRDDVYRLQQAGPPASGGGVPALALDIGASVGMVAILLAKMWPSVRILAIEPAPANFRYLLWNLRINNVAGQVWPLNLAIGGAPAPSKTFVYSPIFPTWSQGKDDSEEEWRGGYADWQVSFQVEVATFAEIVAAVGGISPRIHFLKVDCEGCEWDVFAPLTWSRLRARVGHVRTELHGWALPDKSQASQSLMAAVRSMCTHELLGHENPENILCSSS